VTASDDRPRLPTSPPKGEIAPLFIGALGAPRIELGGEQVQFATRHASWALFSLALADGQTLSLDEVCLRLWPEASEGVLARRLATMTWQMRRGLGEGAWRIVRTRESLSLRLAPIDRVDLLEVRAHADAVLSEGSKVDPALLDALAHPVLEPWSDLDWVRAEQQAAVKLRTALLSRASS
jgi:DNA-binding SARP family transcriptional activator